MKSKILVSACLMGFQVRYNGSQKRSLPTRCLAGSATVGW
jgi:uncharacterized protein YbbK (DUF523 family)